MLYFIVKVLVSAVIIGLISEISKKSTLLGSILASVPLTSILAIIWLYNDTKDEAQIIDLSYNIFWLVLPSLVFFLAFPMLLKANVNFYISLVIAAAIMVLCYFGMVFVMGKIGYKI